VNIFSKKYLFFLILTGLAALVLLGLYHDRRTVAGSNDLDTYYFAAKLVLSGEDLYTHEAFRTTISPYLYLPFLAVAMSPLALLPIRAVGVIWYLLAVGAFLGSIYLLYRLLFADEDIRSVSKGVDGIAAAVSLVFITAIWVDNVSLAQVDFMILFLMLSSVLFMRRGNDVTAGILVAAAGTVKIYPLLFFLYFLAKRKKMALTGVFIGLVLFVVVIPFLAMGQAGYTDSMVKWLSIRAKPHMEVGKERVESTRAHYEAQLKPKNQALSSVATRFLLKDDPCVRKLRVENFKYDIRWPRPFLPWQVDIVVMALILCVLAVTFLGLDYRGRIPGFLGEDLECAVIFLAMILCFPMVKSHTFAPSVLPLALFIKLAAGKLLGRREFILFFLAFALYVSMGLKCMQVLGAGMFSMLLLWWLFVGVIWRIRSI